MSTAKINLSIFHTNDMHGRLENIARLSYYARRLRAEAAAEGRHVLFWDAGDAADRREKICSASKGVAFYTLLNAMGYSLQTMGNALALPYGPQVMAAVAERADFPILAANCRDGAGPLAPGLQERVLISVSEECRLGVFGLTAPWGGLYALFGLHFPDFIETARAQVRVLRGEGATAVILLSHLGLEDDRKVAQNVPGIDVIIGGHSHSRLETGEEVNGVLIAQAEHYAQTIGRVDLSCDPATGRIVYRSARLYDVPANTPADPAVSDALALAEQETAEILATPIGRLEAALNLDHFAECGIGNLAADALRARWQADAAIVASGQFHKGLPAGVITLGDLDSACFSSANPAISLVTGAQIRQALERGLDPNLAEYEHSGFRGTPIGIPQVSGLRVEYDSRAATGARVQSVLVNGEPLDPDRVYRLAHTDAETMNEYGCLDGLEGLSTQHEVPTILREVLEDYLFRRSPMPEPPRGRWIAVKTPKTNPTGA